MGSADRARTFPEAIVMSLKISIDALTISSPPRDLVRDLKITIMPGEIHTLMGPSGCGKSSVLAAICGSLDPALQYTGTISLNGQRIDLLPIQRRRVGLLFQDDLLFPHMTVRENLLFALPAGNRAEREASVQSALKEIELGEFSNANPQSLSGGQRSRVSLMRTLLAQPEAVLLDEPFSKLDAALRGRIRETVFAMLRARNIPTLLVTHDASDVADAARITTLSA
jgi:putative thiamine transport system ATP-binding protein